MISISRKRLSIVLALVSNLSLGIIAEERCAAAVEAKSLVRQYDDGKTQVLTPSVDVSGTFNEDEMKISAGWKQDILTSASADVVTFSSKGVIDDKRTEFDLGYETAIPDGTMAVGYIQSDEDDYHSRIITAGATREFFQKNTVIGFSFSGGLDRITSMSDQNLDERMKHQVYSVSLTQVLSKASIIELLYDLRIENGFIESPYRRAKFIDPTLGISQRPENHPRTRNRNSWAAKYNWFSQSLNVAFATAYRLYYDSWGVLSHTLEEKLTHRLNPKWTGSLALRFYTQEAANFYQDYYSDTSAPFYTGNNTLAAYQSWMIGLRPEYNVSDRINVFGKIEFFKQQFKNATDAGQLSTLSDDKKLEIQALVVGLGMTAQF